jgi:hypothetical protein
MRHIADTAHDRTILQDFLNATMQVSDDRRAIDDGFAFELEHQS